MEQTLVLNATYEPIKVVDWQRAVTLWCQGKVEIVETHDHGVRAAVVHLQAAVGCTVAAVRQDAYQEGLLGLTGPLRWLPACS